MDQMATPETGAVDAPVSMDSIIAEIESGAPAGDTEQEVVAELVEEAEEGHTDEPEKGEEEADEGDATDATDTGEETAEETPEKSEDEPEPAFKVKVAGEEVEVPLSELVKGYSREQDYTRKTMALAEDRKALQAKFAEELQQQVALFEQMDPILAEAGQIDWQRLATEDPATYVQLKAAVDERQAALDKARAKIAEAKQGTSEEERAQQAHIAQEETQALVDKAKEVGLDLSQPEAMNSFAQNAVSYLRGTGFEDSEIADLTDHRALLIIEKARRFDEIERAKAKLPAKKVVPKSQVKPLRTDGTDSSKTQRTRFPASAPRERQLEYIVNKMLEE
jgi:hypothetical protein